MKTRTAEGLALLVSWTALMAVMLVAGCKSSLGTVKGSGTKKTESRTVASFTEVELKISADVDIAIGAPRAVAVETDDNLLAIITTEVNGDRLTIGASEGFSTGLGVNVSITVPELEAVEISGSGDLVVRGLAGERFEARISGSGDIVAKGSVTGVKAEVSGSGDIGMFGLACETAEVSVSGSGDVEVNAATALEARIRGSGDIIYQGSPSVVTEVKGSGTVRRK